MNSLKLILLVIVAAIGITYLTQMSPCSCSEAGGHAASAVEPTGGNQKPADKTIKVKLPKLLELGSKRCIPCRMMAPILEKLTSEYAGIMDVEFIDVWEKENVPAAQKYGITSIPAQIFIDADDRELWRHEGFISGEDILAKWKELGYDLENLKKAQPGTAERK